MQTRFRTGWIFLCITGILIVCAGIPGLVANAANKFAQHAATTSMAKSCQAEWVYDNITIIGYPLVQLGPSYQNANDTNGPETSTFTEAVTGTVALVTSRGLLLVNTSLIAASVTRATSRAVVNAITTTAGNTVSFIVPAHKVAHAEYGVYELEVRGHYYYRDQFCGIPFLLDGGEVTSWCPWYAGWHTWVSGPEQNNPPKNNASQKGTAGQKSSASQKGTAGQKGSASSTASGKSATSNTTP